MVPTDTIKFNVGGRHFEVSRALIDEKCPETTLGNIVSDARDEDPEKAVFIDRDGDIFACVLNHLRYGNVELPVAIPRRMFWRELDYYGIDDAIATNEEYLAGLVREYSHPVERAQKHLARAQRDYNMFALAYECNGQFCRNAPGESDAGEVRVEIEIGVEHVLCQQADAVASSDEKRALLDQFLDRHFGLAVVSFDTNDERGYRFSLVRKGRGR